MQAPRPVLGAAEAGYKALDGVIAFDIKSWTDALSFASQLRKPEVKAKFDTVVIDTMDELVFHAEEFVCKSAGVNTLNDIPWGGGHTQLQKMFKRLFRDITQSGYGLILVAHAHLKQDEEDEKIKYATLGFNKKVKQIMMGLLDILIYVEANRDPLEPNIMHFRSSKFWEAKSRFANIVPSAIFSYDNLERAIADATKGVAKRSDSAGIEKHADSEVRISEADFCELKKATIAAAEKAIERAGQPVVLEEINVALAGRKISETDISYVSALKLLKDKLEDMAK